MYKWRCGLGYNKFSYRPLVAASLSLTADPQSSWAPAAPLAAHLHRAQLSIIINTVKLRPLKGGAVGKTQEI